MGKKRKKETKSKTLLRVVTIVIGLAVAIPMMAGAFASIFSQNNHSNASYSGQEEAPGLEEQIQMQTDGYTKVLEREPKNETAIQGLMQIAQLHLQTGNTKEAIPVLAKIVKYAPEQAEVAKVLAGLRKQEANKPVTKKKESPAASETENPKSP